MKVTIFLALGLLHHSTIATASCEIVELLDHYEAICTGTQEISRQPAPSPQLPISEPVFQQTPAEIVAMQQEQPDPDGPVQIIRSDLSKRLGAYYLKRLQR